MLPSQLGSGNLRMGEPGKDVVGETKEQTGQCRFDRSHLDRGGNTSVPVAGWLSEH